MTYEIVTGLFLVSLSFVTGLMLGLALSEIP